MQADYIVDVFVFGISMLFIVAFAILYIPADSGETIELELESKYNTIVEEDIGLTYLRTYNSQIENNDTFTLLSEFYSLEDGESYWHQKKDIEGAVEDHTRQIASSQEIRPIRNIWIEEILPQGLDNEDSNPKGVVFPIPSSQGVKEVWIDVE